MQWGRYQTGSALAAALLAAASIAASAKDHGVMWFLVGAAIVLLLLAFAPVIPIVRALPVVGAVRLTIAISSQEVGRHSSAGKLSYARLVLRIGVTNPGPSEVRRARVNVLVPASVSIQASDGFGQAIPIGSRGERLPDTSESVLREEPSAVWAERADFDAGSTLLHYAVAVEQPGRYPVRVKIESRSLYELVEVDGFFEVAEED